MNSARTEGVMKSIPVTLILLMLATTPPAFASDATRISWATATKGGGFQLFGENIAKVINATDSGLRVETLATKGSRENLKLLEAGEVDVGQVEGNAARIALDGVGRPAANLKVLSVMYPNPGMFVVRGNSRYEGIEDLKGQPIVFGTKASGLRILANDVLDGLGFDPEKDFQQIILNKAAEGPKLVIEGKAEALWGAGIGWPGFVKVANAPAGGRFIPPAQKQIQQILKKHPHLQKMTVPAGTYKGQKEDIHSVGLWSLILVKPDLDDESVYQLARAIHHGHDALSDRLPQGRYTQAANTVKYVPAKWLHPGAAKYYKEIGLLRASDGIVKITPLGSHDGDFCRFDRTMIFEDPDGTHLLYDAGRTVAGQEYPRLGDFDVILVSHMHGDHVGDRHIPEANAGECATPDFSVDAVPNTNSVNIALAKGAKAEQETVVRDHYDVQLAVMNIGDTFTTGPRGAAHVINNLVKPKAFIASHANEQATRNGELLTGTRTEQFIQVAEMPAHIPLSGKTMAFNGQGRCQSGCE